MSVRERMSICVYACMRVYLRVILCACVLGYACISMFVLNVRVLKYRSIGKHTCSCAYINVLTRMSVNVFAGISLCLCMQE